MPMLNRLRGCPRRIAAGTNDAEQIDLAAAALEATLHAHTIVEILLPGTHG